MEDEALGISYTILVVLLANLEVSLGMVADRAPWNSELPPENCFRMVFRLPHTANGIIWKNAHLSFVRI